MHVLPEKKLADGPTRHVWTGIGQTAERGAVTFQFISSDNADLGIRLAKLHHAPETVRKDPIVGLHHLAIFAIARDLRKRKVVVWYLGKK
jgi:hypothetical protein